MAKPDVFVFTIDINISWWTALKMRLAGVSFVQGYAKAILEESLLRVHGKEDLDDDAV